MSDERFPSPWPQIDAPKGPHVVEVRVGLKLELLLRVKEMKAAGLLPPGTRFSFGPLPDRATRTDPSH
jgi:hypothetical protein